MQILEQLRETQGEYTFAGQYQQNPAPLGGGMVKPAWFKSYTPAELPENSTSSSRVGTPPTRPAS